MPGSTKDRLFELTNPVSATGAGDSHFVQRTVIPHVSHEGLAFDKNNNFYFIDEVNGRGGNANAAGTINQTLFVATTTTDEVYL